MQYTTDDYFRQYADCDMLKDMHQPLLNRLKIWRRDQAAKEGVDLFRVLPNTTLEAIARTIPQTAADFLAIKGIKEARWKKYGAALLAMVGDVVAGGADGEINLSTSSDHLERQEDSGETMELLEHRTLYTVSGFLDAMNGLLEAMTIRIKGEVSSIEKREKTVYFTLKDTADGSVLSCLMFQYRYQVAAMDMTVGMEVIVDGVSGIWKPTGRFSLNVQSVEISGEGALQKAYNDLKNKLTDEGIFAVDRKRSLPKLPQRIALITSREGAAIGDFLTNIGKRGYTVSLYHASVEGKRAVFELLEAMRFFQKYAHHYDVLVMIRGGGSLESLQAFNNEILVRAVAASSIPVVCGVGHEKDISLAALAADTMVSTPTAAAKVLEEGFVSAQDTVRRCEHTLIKSFQKMITVSQNRYDRASRIVFGGMHFAKERYVFMHTHFLMAMQRFLEMIQSTQGRLKNFQSIYNAHNPERLLARGYAIIMNGTASVRSVREMAQGDTVRIRMIDGQASAVVSHLESTEEMKKKHL